MIALGILAFAGIMSSIVTATLYTLDNTLTLHTTLRNTMETIKAPRGVNGKNRELFLALTPEQQETYLYHFNVIGRPAALAYNYTIWGW